MKRLVFIIVLLPLILLAEVQRQEIRFPGAKGMNSNTDPMDIDVSAARLLKNLSPFRVPGALRARRGLLVEQALNGLSGSLLGGYGYYNSADKYKLILGVSKIGSGAGDTSYAEFVRSDTFKYDLQPDSVGPDSPVFIAPTRPGHSDYYDFEKIEDIMVIADGHNPPWMFTPVSSVLDSTDTTLAMFLRHDTVEYKPRVRQLGLEAPGQVRPVVIKDSGNLSGAYAYRIAFLFDVSATINFDPADSVSHAGPVSSVVFPVNQQVHISLFEDIPQDFDNHSGIDTITYAVIIRQKNGGTWFVIDTVNYNGRLDSAAWTYTDDKADGTGLEYKDDAASINIYGNLSKIANRRTIAQPGGFKKGIARTGTFGNPEAVAGGGAWGDILDTGKNYWIAYSYYDPITGAESPLGPFLRLDSLLDFIDTVGLTAGDNDTGRAFTYRKGFTNENERPAWVRLYRSLGDDSTIMVALYQVRANFMLYKADDVDGAAGDSDEVRYNWIPAFVSESQAVSGNFGAAETRFNYSSTRIGPLSALGSINEVGHINTGGKGGGTIGKGGVTSSRIGRGFVTHSDLSHVATDEIGLPIIRPPYPWGAQIALSDVAFSAGRLWGIGDPAFPQRLYYSKFNNIYNMSPNDFLSMDESDADELVGIEVAEGSFGRVLYVFKHNKIFMVRGDDPEHDLTWFPISTNVGAVNKKSIQKVGNEIYFLGNDFRVYQIRGASEPVDVSLPVQDRFWSLYTFDPGFLNFFNAKPFSYQIGDNVCWGNEDSTFYMAFNYKMRIWAEYQYGSDTATTFADIRTPKFSFPYDTAKSKAGFRSDFRVVAVGGDSLCIETEAPFDDLAMGGASNHHIEKEYESSCFGDGENLWRLQRVVFSTRLITSAGKEDTIIVWAVSDKGGLLDSVKVETPTTGVFEVGFTGLAAQPCMSFRVSYRSADELISGADFPLFYKMTAYYEKVIKGEIH